MAVDAERWATLPMAEQMANIGSEVGRTAKWILKGKTDLARGAYLRALELQDLTIRYGRVGQNGRRELLKELCRARECFNGAFLSSDIDMLKYLDKYFTQFAAICRR